MNANSPQPTPVIKNWLSSASKKLSDANIPSSKLDAELILSFTLGVDRTYLHAHDIDTIDTKSLDSVNNLLSDRLNRKPIAYIIGNKEFYGREFIVTSKTLIPRPESEDIITMLKKFLPTNDYDSSTVKLVDVGTGSGCLGITAKLEFPSLDVSLTDIDPNALDIAKKNSERLSAKVKIIKNDLLKNYRDNAEIIIANLPYVDKFWNNHSPEIEFEPSLALYATDSGLYFIKKLIKQASSIQTLGNIIILEADPCQHPDLIEYAKKYQYSIEDKIGYILLFKKT